VQSHGVVDLFHEVERDYADEAVEPGWERVRLVPARRVTAGL